MQSLSQFNTGSRSLSCIIYLFSKYAWIVPLEDERGVSIVNAFQRVLDKSGSKPNKIWVDKESEFYNSSFKKWLNDIDIELYSIHNEEKSLAAERFIKTLKTKIYKYMTAISKNAYFDKLDDIVDEQNNTYHRTIKMKQVDVKIMHILTLVKKLIIKILKDKNIFTKGYTPNWSQDVFVIKRS